MNDDTVARALARDHRTADLAPADRAMLEYAVKLTLAPGEMEEADVERLRQHGFSDAAILDICQGTAYYAYVNRLADGLGVELEARWNEEDLILTPGDARALGQLLAVLAALLAFMTGPAVMEGFEARRAERRSTPP